VIELRGKPVVGMLCWESGKYPKGFDQLATLVGNTTNPATFDFPILYERVKGANYETVVLRPSEEVLNEMVKASLKMVNEGVKVVATSCGFNIIFQDKLARAVNSVGKALVATSSLLLVPLVSRMLGGRRVGIMTANSDALTKEHLRAAGIDDSVPVCIMGIQDVGEWRKMIEDPEATIDLRKLEQEVTEKAKQLVNQCPDIGAIVLECTDLPPFAPSIRKATGLPVFDVNMLITMLYKASTNTK
jgi:hypothetical protein